MQKYDADLNSLDDVPKLDDVALVRNAQAALGYGVKSPFAWALLTELVERVKPQPPPPEEDDLGFGATIEEATRTYLFNPEFHRSVVFLQRMMRTRHVRFTVEMAIECIAALSLLNKETERQRDEERAERAELFDILYARSHVPCSVCGHPLRWSRICDGWLHVHGISVPWERHQPQNDRPEGAHRG